MKMKSPILPTICILATSILILASRTSPVFADEAADIAAISAVWVQYRSALNSGDIDAMISLWVDDGIMLPPGSLPVIGKENIRTTAEAPLDHYIRDVAVIQAPFAHRHVHPRSLSQHWFVLQRTENLIEHAFRFREVAFLNQLNGGAEGRKRLVILFGLVGCLGCHGRFASTRAPSHGNGAPPEPGILWLNLLG